MGGNVGYNQPMQDYSNTGMDFGGTNFNDPFGLQAQDQAYNAMVDPSLTTTSAFGDAGGSWWDNMNAKDIYGGINTVAGLYSAFGPNGAMAVNKENIRASKDKRKIMNEDAERYKQFYGAASNMSFGG